MSARRPQPRATGYRPNLKPGRPGAPQHGGPDRGARPWSSSPAGPRTRPGLYYDPAYVSDADDREIREWLATLHPIWEERYSSGNPPPPGQQQRRLLRPVYWLGNWQFACLDYYRPPQGILNRCVEAEPYPAVLARLVARAEEITRKRYSPADIPAGWHLNTCLVNFYGDRLEDGRRVDAARVGEHKDFEPGPVASISLGERALFQFVRSARRGDQAEVVHPQWLDDRSLLIFGSEQWKSRTFHRVLRVDRRAGSRFAPEIPGFETRRVNFTFRFVPDEHVVPLAQLAPEARADVRGYVEELARYSAFFREALARADA